MQEIFKDNHENVDVKDEAIEMDDIIESRIESEHSLALAKKTRSDSDQSEPNIQCYTCGFEEKPSLMKEHMTMNHKGNLNPCFCIRMIYPLDLLKPNT